MSTDRISRLHEQASEHYLNGDYPAALASWREVLALDPRNEAALEGARMASQFASEHAEASRVTASPELEQDLDLGLKVFDSLASKAPAPAAFDLGDPSQVDAAPVLVPTEEGWEPSTPSEEISFGLAPAAASSVESTNPAPTAAAVELRRRVDDLLTQARTKIQAGERDEALAILARVTILDEENADAATLRHEVETAGRTDFDRIEQAIIEGVAALESDRLDDAERLFQEALTLSPEHREALHYMEQVQARRSAPAASPDAPQEDLLGSGSPFGDLPEAPAAEPAVIPVASKSRSSRPLPPSMPEAQRPARRGLSLPSPKLLLVGGLLALVGVCAYLALPMLTGGGKEAAPAAPPRPAPTQRPVAGAPKAAPAPPAVSATPVGTERTAAVAPAIARAKHLVADGDYAGAVVAYNEAIQLDPANLDAREGLAGAASQYKSQKSDEEAVKAIETAFAGGEYASALRLAYRLPGTIEAARIDRIKVVGWYNLAVVALRAGDCRGAVSNLDEVLGIVPGDGEAQKLKDFAARYADVPKDRAFLDTVEALPFRSLR
jgi:tetratricopeptide (TPR) repeat protein